MVGGRATPARDREHVSGSAPARSIRADRDRVDRRERPLAEIVSGRARWFVAGIAPTVSDTKLNLTAQSLTDVNDDGIPDGMPGLASTTDDREQPLEHRRVLDPGHAARRLRRRRASPHAQRDRHAVERDAVRRSTRRRRPARSTPSHYVGDVIATYRAETHDTQAAPAGRVAPLVAAASPRAIRRRAEHPAAAVGVRARRRSPTIRCSPRSAATGPAIRFRRSRTARCRSVGSRAAAPASCRTSPPIG